MLISIWIFDIVAGIFWLIWRPKWLSKNPNPILHWKDEESRDGQDGHSNLNSGHWRRKQQQQHNKPNND